MRRAGGWRGREPVPTGASLEGTETQLEGAEQAAFVRFVRSMLRWRPEERARPEELLRDPWLCSEGDFKALDDV